MAPFSPHFAKERASFPWPTPPPYQPKSPQVQLERIANPKDLPKRKWAWGLYCFYIFSGGS